jgi:hypothetical protein
VSPISEAKERLGRLVAAWFEDAGYPSGGQSPSTPSCSIRLSCRSVMPNRWAISFLDRKGLPGR